jgi:hypothetical protein
MMEYIIHPITRRRLSLFSNEGKQLIKSYIKIYQSGGTHQLSNNSSTLDDLDDLITKVMENNEEFIIEDNSNSLCNSTTGVKIAEGKMGKIFKMNVEDPNNKICKSMKSSFSNNEIPFDPVESERGEINLYASGPWKNQTLLGYAILKSGNAHNILINGDAKYNIPLKTGYNFMEQANGDLSKVLEELNDINNADINDEIKEDIIDIMLQTLYILQHLQLNCHFIHGDLKDKNVFYIKKLQSSPVEISYIVNNDGHTTTYKSTGRYIVKVADLDKSSCEYINPQGKIIRFVPLTGNNFINRSLKGIGVNPCSVVSNLQYEKLDIKHNWYSGSTYYRKYFKLEQLATYCGIRHFESKPLEILNYDLLLEIGKSFDIFCILTSLLSYKTIYTYLEQNGDFIRFYIGLFKKSQKDLYRSLLTTSNENELSELEKQTLNDLNNKTRLSNKEKKQLSNLNRKKEGNPVSSQGTIFNRFKNILVPHDLYLYISVLINILQRYNTPKSLDVSESKSLDVSESKPLDVSESKSLDVSESKSLDVSESKSLDVSESKPLDVSESKSLDVSESKSLDVSESKPLSLS